MPTPLHFPSSPSLPTPLFGPGWVRCLRHALLLLLLLGSLPSLAQSRRYVKPGGKGDGSSWANAGDLQAQIMAALPGAEVWVLAGTYIPTDNPYSTSPTDPRNTDPRYFCFYMRDNIKIYGGFAGNELNLSDRRLTYPSSTTLSGDVGNAGVNTDNCYHVIKNATALNNTPKLTTTALLDGFVITGGNANGSAEEAYGGGIYNDGRSGAFCNPTIQNCTFTKNSATQGGAIMNDGYTGTSSPQLINCSFLSNTAGKGGGVFNSGNSGNSNPRLTNCSFLSNTATIGGGAIFNFGESGYSSPRLINCSFLSNSTAGRGGALYNMSYPAGTSSPVLINCSFQGNIATDDGGAMVNDSGKKIDPIKGGVSIPTLTSCVFYNNGGVKTVGLINNPNLTIATYSLFETSVINYNDTGTGNFTTPTSPFISSTSTRLAAGSLSIDRGSPSPNLLVGTTDVDGNARIFNNRIDIGAVEFQTIQLAPTASASAICVGGTVTLSVKPTYGSAPYSYNWKAPAGAAISGSTSTSSVLATVLLSGPQTFTVTVDGFVGTAQSFTTVVVTGNPRPDVTLTSANVCAGQPVNLSATSGFNSYTFTGPGITTGTGNTRTLPNLGVGTYSYSVLASNAAGCQNVNPATTTVTVNALPSATLTVGPSATLTCAQPTLTLTASGGDSYKFSGPGGVLNSNSSTATVNAAGTYSVTVTSATGCQSVATVTILKNATPPAPTLTTGSSPTLTCTQSSLTLTASGGDSYKFSGPGVLNSSGNTLVVNAPGTYSVTATNTANGCQETTSAVIFASGDQRPVITTQPASATTVNVGTAISVAVSATGTGVLKYQWYKDGSLVPSATSSTLSLSGLALSQSGTYICVVQNNCGPTSSMEFKLTVINLLGVEQPISSFQVEVYPNPAIGDKVWVKIQGAAQQPVQLHVMDTKGRLIWERIIAVTTPEHIEQLDLSNLSAGLLLLRASTPEQSQSKKLLKY